MPTSQVVLGVYCYHNKNSPSVYCKKKLKENLQFYTHKKQYASSVYVMDKSIQFVDSFGDKEFWKSFLDNTNDEMAHALIGGKHSLFAE